MTATKNLTTHVLPRDLEPGVHRWVEHDGSVVGITHVSYVEHDGSKAYRVVLALPKRQVQSGVQPVRYVRARMRVEVQTSIPRNSKEHTMTKKQTAKKPAAKPSAKAAARVRVHKYVRDAATGRCAKCGAARCTLVHGYVRSK